MIDWNLLIEGFIITTLLISTAFIFLIHRSLLRDSVLFKKQISKLENNLEKANSQLHASENKIVLTEDFKRSLFTNLFTMVKEFISIQKINFENNQ